MTGGKPSRNLAVLIVEKGVEADGREEDIKGVWRGSKEWECREGILK